MAMPTVSAGSNGKRSILRIIICICLSGALFSAGTVMIASYSVPFNMCAMTNYLLTHGRKVIQGADGWLFFRPNVRVLLWPWRNNVRNCNVICSLSDTCSKLGIRLLLVPIPEKEEIIQAYSPVSVTIANNQKLRFLKKLAKNGVPVIDLTIPYLQHPRFDRLYQKRDTHWDQEGISLAADLIASRLTPFFLGRPRSNYLRKDTMIFERCDLASLLHDSTAFSRKCTMVLNTDSSHYKDSLSADIMIFGDSFTDVNRRYGAGIGAQIAYFVQQPTFTYVRLRANDQGPRLLLSFLKSRKTAPKVIVWIFASRYLYYKIEPFSDSTG